MKKKTSRIILSLIVFLPFLLVLVYLIGLPVLEKLAREKAISSLEEQIGSQVEIGSVSIEPFKQKVIIHEMMITNPHSPSNNILAFNKTELNFRLKDYWDSKVVYLSDGFMSGTRIDLQKKNGKPGWVDLKRYPKKQLDRNSLQGRVKAIDLKAMKSDFKNNFRRELKNTQIYKDYDRTYSDIKSKVDGQYKEKLKAFEADFKILRKSKVDKANLAQTLHRARVLKERFDSLKSEFEQLKKLQSLYKHQGNLLNKAQAQVIGSFLDRQGFGDLKGILQDKVQSLFKSGQKTAQVSTSKKETQLSTKATTKSAKRDDVLFHVNQFIIKGDEQDIKGEISQFHNQHGESFKDWIGELKLAGNLDQKSKLAVEGKRLEKTQGPWNITGNIQNFSLDSYDLFSFGKISKGELNLKFDLLFGEQASLNALVDIDLKKVLTQSLFLESLAKAPLKILIRGESSNTQSHDMRFSTKFLTKLPDLMHPLQSQLGSELASIANLQKSVILHNAVNFPDLSNYRTQIDKLISQWKKQGLKKLFKGFLKKL